MSFMARCSLNIVTFGTWICWQIWKLKDGSVSITWYFRYSPVIKSFSVPALVISGNSNLVDISALLTMQIESKRNFFEIHNNPRICHNIVERTKLKNWLSSRGASVEFKTDCCWFSLSYYAQEQLSHCHVLQWNHAVEVSFRPLTLWLLISTAIPLKGIFALWGSKVCSNFSSTTKKFEAVWMISSLKCRVEKKTVTIC